MFLQNLMRVPQRMLLQREMTMHQSNTLKENLKMSSEGETEKRKTLQHKKCHHFDIDCLLTFFHCCTRDSHFKCQQAHRVEGGVSGGGYCGRADLIKQQAATVHTKTPTPSPRYSPPHLSSTERWNKSDRVQSLSLICQ